MSVIYAMKILKRPKGVPRCRNSKDKKYNGQQKKYKKTNNDTQNITHKTKKNSTRIPPKPG
jgi:hypothetical protein